MMKQIFDLVVKVIKQRITVEQLDELSDEMKDRLREWWNPQRYDLGYIEQFNHKSIIYTGICLIDETDDDYVYVEMKSSENEDDYFGCNKYNILPLSNIGQMIEFLFHHSALELAYGTEPAHYFNGVIIDWNKDDFREFVDNLWAACKLVLNNEF